MEKGLSERERAKRVICAIIDAAGGRLEGKLRLFKAFYHAHLIYFENGPGIVLSGHPIVHMPQGPGIHDAARLLHELESEGCIAIEIRSRGDRQEYVYTLKDARAVDRTSPEFDAISRAVKQVKAKTARQLSDETHDLSRSWNNTSPGEELNIYIDVMPDDEYRRMQESIASVKRTFSEPTTNAA